MRSAGGRVAVDCRMHRALASDCALVALRSRRVRQGSREADTSVRVGPQPRRDADDASTTELPFHYPAALYARKVQGNVTLRLFVDATGTCRPRLDARRGVERLRRARLGGGTRLARACASSRPSRTASRMPMSILFPVVFPSSRSAAAARRHDPEAEAGPDGLKAMTAPRNRKPYDDVLETIGWTPLIRLNRVTRGMRTPVYAKAEFFNPGGSVKDRIGAADHRAGRARGAAQAGRDDRRRARAATPASGSRSRRRSRATSASSRCRTRCRRRRCGCSRRSAPK